MFISILNEFLNKVIFLLQSQVIVELLFFGEMMEKNASLCVRVCVSVGFKNQHRRGLDCKIV